MYKILFEQGDRHDATVYYVDVIRETLADDGKNDVTVVDDIKEINSEDIVVVVNAKAAVRVWMKHWNQKVICWYQGVMPEEIYVFYRGYTKWMRIMFWIFLEMISLRRNAFSIFVSEKMRSHYQSKYRLKLKNNYYIMPCFNQEINEESFWVKDKYTRPTFLYAGTLSKWQCIDKMLSLYAEIEAALPNATLFLYTSEQEKAKDMVAFYRIKNAFIKYVPFTQLNAEISKCKYGFIVREDIEMNRVATPTKMNSYLANGIIPIYTGCIDSFRQNLSSLKFQILLGDNPISQIVEFESELINPADIYHEYNQKVFSDYYSRQSHLNKLRNSLKRSGLL